MKIAFVDTSHTDTLSVESLEYGNELPANLGEESRTVWEGDTNNKNYPHQYMVIMIRYEDSVLNNMYFQDPIVWKKDIDKWISKEERQEILNLPTIRKLLEDFIITEGSSIMGENSLIIISTVFTAIATVVIAIATCYYVYYSKKLWKETRNASLANALCCLMENQGWQRKKATLEELFPKDLHGILEKVLNKETQ